MIITIIKQFKLKSLLRLNCLVNDNSNKDFNFSK